MRRPLALYATALVASAIAGIFAARRELAAAGGLPPPVEAVSRAVPPYPGAPFYALGEELHVDGWARRMAYALTPDAPRRVADRYEAVWRSQGLDVQRRGDGLVSAVGAGLRRTVVISEAAPFFTGRPDATLLVASVTGDAELRGAPTRLPLPAPCELDESTGARDTFGAAEALQATCALSPDEVEHFYDASLAGLEKFVGAPTYIEYNGEGMHVRLSIISTSSAPPRTRVSLAWQEAR